MATKGGPRITRQALLEGAYALLDAGELSDLTVDALARHMQMSKSTLYKYYVGKDEVVNELISGVCETTSDELAALSHPADPVEALHDLFEVVADYAERLPRAAILQPDKLPTVARLRLESMRALISEMIAERVEIGCGTGAFTFRWPVVASTTLACAVFTIMEAVARVEEDRSAGVFEVLNLVLPGLQRALDGGAEA